MFTLRGVEGFTMDGCDIDNTGSAMNACQKASGNSLREKKVPRGLFIGNDNWRLAVYANPEWLEDRNNCF